MKKVYPFIFVLLLFCSHLLAAPNTSASPSNSKQALFADEPWSPSFNASFTAVTNNNITFNWLNGDGFYRIVVARKGSPVDFMPIDGMYYAANSNFGSGDNLDFSGGQQFVVYNGNGSDVTITNLEPNTTYHFAVFEYNVDPPFDTNPNYLTWQSLTASQTTKPTPLPLTWLSFDYTKNSNGIELKWSTAEELNTASFEVERSKDGLSFQRLASLLTNNLITTNYYRYIDAGAQGELFYRIKQVDTDGRYTYSKVLAIQAFSNNRNPKIFPNPVKDQLFVQNAERALVNIYDPAGRRVLTVSLQSSSPINLQSLVAGSYFIEIIEGLQYYRLQFIKK